MLFLGGLVLTAMVYGMAHVVGGVAMPVLHPTLKKTKDFVVNFAQTTSTGVYGYTEEDGFLQVHRGLRIDAVLGELHATEQYKQFLEEETLAIQFDLTPREFEEVQTLIAPMILFETYGSALPLRLQDAQRAAMMSALLSYLSKIPEVRRVKDERRHG